MIEAEWRPHEPSRETALDTWRSTIVDRAVAIVRRPVRFRSGHTLEVFNADAKEQLPVQRRLHDVLQEIWSKCGQSMLLFHTCNESARLYADFVDAFPHTCAFTVKVNFDGKQKYFCDLCGKCFR
jgi:hypothetical protein